MPLVDAYDEAWLLARERGEAATHPDAERARGYERLAQALAQPPSRKPPLGFEANLFAALDREERAGADASTATRRGALPGRLERSRDAGENEHDTGRKLDAVIVLAQLGGHAPGGTGTRGRRARSTGLVRARIGPGGGGRETPCYCVPLYGSFFVCCSQRGG
jgi:hypothetical protein